jgi:glycosyltransferase involved in cell wall biosynthesis
MRVLHVSDRLTDRGGAYGWMLGIVEGLAAAHDQELVVGHDDGTSRVACRVHVRDGLQSRTGQAVELDDLAQRAQVVHLHNVTNPAVLDWAASRANAVLTIQDHRFFCAGRGKWTAAGEACRTPLTEAPCSRCFEDQAYFHETQALTERRLAAARRLPLTVLSRYMRGELVSAGVPVARVLVVPPFVHGIAIEQLAAPEEPSCVLFVGRLAEAKGVLDAVEAWRLSEVQQPLVVAGTGPLRTELERIAAAHEPSLHVLGWVEHAALAPLYRRASALIFPPRWQEPFGIAGLEALCFGVPVVGWESGAVEEWHPGPGLVRWGDLPGLAHALRQAVTRRVRRPPRFERDEAIGRLLALYARVAAA